MIRVDRYAPNKGPNEGGQGQANTASDFALDTFPQTRIMVWIWSLFVSAVAAASARDLVGTWTTKSKMVLTGPVCTIYNMRTTLLISSGLL